MKIIKKLVFIIFTFIFGVYFGFFINNKYTESSKKSDNKYNCNSSPIIECDKDNELSVYYTENGRTVYQLGDLYYYLGKNELRLHSNFFEAFDKYLENFEVFNTYEDNSIMYRNKNEYILKCNNENKDIYIGENLEYKDNYCKSETKDLFVQTFNVLSVVNNMDALYYYVTIRKFNFDEVYTARILKSLNPNMKANLPYEFTFRYTDYKFQNNLHNPDDISLDSLFKNADLLKVVETDKYGLEQINDTIRR